MPNTILNQQTAVSLQLTDYALIWQGGQSPSTRKMTISNLATYYLALAGGTVTGDVIFSAAKPKIRGNAGTVRALQFQTGATTRWQLDTNATAESGLSAGSDLELWSYTDAGAQLVKVLAITRSTGAVAINAPLSVVNNAITLSNNQPIGAKNNVGVVEQMFLMDTNNNVTIQNGGGSLVRVINQAASTNLMTIDDGGVVTLGAGPLVVTGSRSGTIAGAGELNSAGVFTGISGTITFSANFTQAVLSGVAFYAGSDERAKDNLSAISASDAEAWVMSGKPLTFLVDGVKHAGFSAQDETKTVRRESITAAVSDDPRFSVSDGIAPDGHRLLKDYQHDIAYLTRFVQVLVERIAALEAKAG